MGIRRVGIGGISDLEIEDNDGTPTNLEISSNEVIAKALGIVIEDGMETGYTENMRILDLEKVKVNKLLGNIVDQLIK